MQAAGYPMALAEGYVEDLARAFAVGYAKGFDEGCLEAARETLILVGSRELGWPDEAAEAWVKGLKNLDHIHEFIDRVREYSNWWEFQEIMSRARPER